MSGYGAPPGSYGTVPASPTTGALHERKRRDRRLLMWGLLASALILTLLLWRCGTSFYRAAIAADAAKAEFHKKLNGEQYHEIYAQADRRFQASGTEEELTDFFRSVHQKLGEAGETTRQNISINTNTGGTYTTVIYQTKFAHGNASETFTWRVNGERLLLVGYNIQSRELFRK